MQKLVLIAVAMFFGSASSASPQGYCDRGLYIPTHVIECVAFCKNRGNVATLKSPSISATVRICECATGSIKVIPEDPQNLECGPLPEVSESERRE